MKRYSIASIPGDGIGRKVVPAAIGVLKTAAERCGFTLEFRDFDWRCQTYLESSKMMPGDGLYQLRDHDADFLGAVGYPRVPDHISLRGCCCQSGASSSSMSTCDRCGCCRELPRPCGTRRRATSISGWCSQTPKANIRRSAGTGTGEDEIVVQRAIFTRCRTDRILSYAFDFARRLGRKYLTSATKSNGLNHSMPFWDERYAAVGAGFPDVAADQYHVDILAARFVMSPERFDVVVGSNLFGDILSDLGPGIIGTTRWRLLPTLTPNGGSPQCSNGSAGLHRTSLGRASQI